MGLGLAGRAQHMGNTIHRWAAVAVIPALAAFVHFHHVNRKHILYFSGVLCLFCGLICTFTTVQGWNAGEK